MPATPDPSRKSPQELAFARSHPELATLATAQIREAMAVARAHRRMAEDQEHRIAALAKWAREHGIDTLPLDCL